MAKRHELFIGASGTGKSESILRLIQKMWRLHGKKARVCIGDGSAATYDDSGLVDMRVIETLDWSARDYPTTTLNELAEGYWPKDPKDPKSPLLPPDPAVLATIGVYAFEGLSTAGLYILGDNIGGLAQRSSLGEKLGQDSPIQYVDGPTDALGKFKPDPKNPHVKGKSYGGNPLSHYGIAQKRMLGVIDRTKGLPVDFVVWTAHERAAEDKLSKEIIIGPECAGGAMTPWMQRGFNNTVHHVLAEKTTRDQDEFTLKSVSEFNAEYRIYTRDHFMPAGNVLTRCKAVTRGVPAGDGEKGTMPLYIVGKEPGDAIEEYYNRLANIRRDRFEAEQKLAEERAAKSA